MHHPPVVMPGLLHPAVKPQQPSPCPTARTAPCPQVHAEQCLMTNLLLHQERAVQLVAISEAPCGHCRQFFSELVCAVGGHSLGQGGGHVPHACMT